eukprot:PhM_4_TR18675/c0_g1_i4/m.71097
MNLNNSDNEQQIVSVNDNAPLPNVDPSSPPPLRDDTPNVQVSLIEVQQAEEEEGEGPPRTTAPPTPQSARHRPRPLSMSRTDNNIKITNNNNNCNCRGRNNSAVGNDSFGSGLDQNSTSNRYFCGNGSDPCELIAAPHFCKLPTGFYIFVTLLLLCVANIATGFAGIAAIESVTETIIDHTRELAADHVSTIVSCSMNGISKDVRRSGRRMEDAFESRSSVFTEFVEECNLLRASVDTHQAVSCSLALLENTTVWTLSADNNDFKDVSFGSFSPQQGNDDEFSWANESLRLYETLGLRDAHVNMRFLSSVKQQQPYVMMTSTSIVLNPATGHVIAVLGMSWQLKDVTTAIQANYVGRNITDATTGFLVTYSGDLIAVSGDMSACLASVGSTNKLTSHNNLVSVFAADACPKFKEVAEEVRDDLVPEAFRATVPFVNITSKQYVKVSVGGTTHWVDIVPFKFANQRWFYVSAVNRESYYDSIVFSQLMVAIILVLVGAMSFIVAVCFVFRLRRPLHRFLKDMEHISVMELDTIDLNAPYSMISEIAQLQYRIRLTVQHLIEYRAFMPECVLMDPLNRSDEVVSEDSQVLVPPVEGGEGEGATPAGSTTAAASLSLVVEGGNSAPETPQTQYDTNAIVSLPHVPTGGGGDASSAESPAVPAGRRDRSLNRTLTPEVSSSDTGEGSRLQRLRGAGFRMFNASFLVVTLSTHSPESIQRATTRALDIIDKHGGVPGLVRPDRIMASWNAFRPCPRYHQDACRAAQSLHNVFPSSRIVVSAGPVHVGFVGSIKVRTPVIIGEATELLSPILELCTVLNTKILATERVARKAEGQFQFAAVDVVESPSGAALTIYELLSNNDNLSDAQRTEFDRYCYSYKSGFSSLVTEKYSAASTSLLQFLVHDSQNEHEALARHALRLLQLSRYHEANNLPKYVRRIGSTRWEVLEDRARSLPLPDEIALRFSFLDSVVGVVGSAGGIPSGGNASSSAPNTAEGFQGSKTPMRTSSFTKITSQIEDARKKKAIAAAAIGAFSMSSDGTANDTDSTTTTPQPSGGNLDLSTFTVDGEVYHKSEKLLGKGATAAVHLGMADDGSLVAIKCCQIPERAANQRKTLSQYNDDAKDPLDDVLSEIRVLAKLRHDNVVSYLGCAVVNA